MEFGPTSAQEEFREVAHAFLATRYPPERVAELADSAYGHAVDGWDPLVRMGWLDPELDLTTLALLAEESGYVLHPTPWWSTLGLPPTTPATPVPRTFAWYDERCRSLRDTASRSACRAVRSPDAAWRVSGTKRLVPDLASASEVVLSAETPDGVALFSASPTGPGVSVTPTRSLDGLRRLSRLRCVDAPVRPLTESGAATREALGLIRWRTLTLLAAEAVGVAARALDLAAGHARERTQFGRPIGSYQGVAFRIADSYLATELARTLAYRAAWLVDQSALTPPAEVDGAVACAVVAGRDAALAACEHAMQVLGGIAMTWAHPVHRWYRRALWLRSFDASSSAHLAELAAQLLEADDAPHG
ncbi:acyl-CoA dehydrogenase [Solihabitans fulvus]|uniref:Acyl-CoA dehydrogenase n=1 Tax=Solihabitans fulvus TaxID=1892852 RepID=A0A5B2XSG7_9PSEU|nr:acyl-CoA dehydrogenase [Solihabitans fulvus]KAA2265811.1 acyl-CoA dehydrogenase [Solihabitans fulvus]